MMNSKILFKELLSSLTLPESRDEVRSIAYQVLEKLLGITQTDVIAEKSVEVPPTIKKQLREYADRINSHEPLQYVLGECYFFGRLFKVNPAVLIPRPETEELVRVILKAIPHETKELRILDIGTGSGCIAVTLAKEIAGAEVFATDVSQEALQVAEENAARLGANVKFILNDILTEEIPVNDLSVIVSNPPYIMEMERSQMKDNVVKYEPGLALFVPQNDPVLFHSLIARKATSAFNDQGFLVFEINEKLGDDVTQVLKQNSYTQIHVIKDLSGKERIATGVYTKRNIRNS